MTPSREALHAVVERSPACVAAHDREGWLALFGAAAWIEDPVGSAVVPKASGALGRFYDTFIAPHQIKFAIRRDHYLGIDVFRDAVIHTRVRPGVEVEVAAYLLYQLAEETGELRVRRDVDERGIVKITKENLDLIAGGVNGLHVSFDLDVMDPEIAPGVSTDSRGGLSYRESHLALELLADTNLVRSIDIVELNPARDVRNQTAELAVELIQSALGKNIL
mgnify:CR=1 FL=1